MIKIKNPNQQKKIKFFYPLCSSSSSSSSNLICVFIRIEYFSFTLCLSFIVICFVGFLFDASFIRSFSLTNQTIHCLKFIPNCSTYQFLAPLLSRERASIFLSYNECIRRMNCPPSTKEECSEECATGKSIIILFISIQFYSYIYFKEIRKKN